MSRIDTGTGGRPNGAAFIVAAGLAALGALLIWQGNTIPDKGGYAGIGSGDMPKFIGWGLVALAIGHVASGLRHSAEPRERQMIVPVLLIIAGLALQLVLLKPLGFSVASALLFACTAAAFGKRNLVLTLPIGIGFAFAVYVVFDQLLRLNLPAGLLENLIVGG
jgi:putative tricarboxylic transport membrane protein